MAAAMVPAGNLPAPTSTIVPTRMRTMLCMKALPSTTIEAMRGSCSLSTSTRVSVRTVLGRSSAADRKLAKSWVPTAAAASRATADTSSSDTRHARARNFGSRTASTSTR
jgi:hypothetical protein